MSGERPRVAWKPIGSSAVLLGLVLGTLLGLVLAIGIPLGSADARMVDSADEVPFGLAAADRSESGDRPSAAGSAAASEAARAFAGRLDPQTAAAIVPVVEEAAQSGLPTQPLIAKALEGAAKRAPGPRIVQAVRAYAQALGRARNALGPQSKEAEIVAGAGALLGGVVPDTLARLRAARPGQSLVVPLVVLADLLSRRVPPPAASAAVLTPMRAGARDPDLLRIRERVEHDIRGGISPVTAASTRARSWIDDRRPSSPGSERKLLPKPRRSP